MKKSWISSSKRNLKSNFKMHFARRLSYRYLDLTRIFSPFHRNLKLLILLFSISSPAIVLYEIDQNIADPTDSDSKPYILISIYILILLRLTVQLMATLSWLRNLWSCQEKCTTQVIYYKYSCSLL